MRRTTRRSLLLLAVATLVAGGCVSTPPADTTPPVLTLPGPMVEAATSAAGAMVTWEATAVDDVDGPVTADCTPEPGLFPPGQTTTVTCSAVDAAGNVTSGSFAVTVGAWSPPGPTDSVTIGDETITVTVPDGLVVTVDPVVPGSTPPPPTGIEFPFGLISIVVDGADPGAVVPVDVTFESPVDVVRKLINGAWNPFSFDGSTGAVLSPDGTSVQLYLRDGGRGDADGVADGHIVDPLGPGRATELTITSDAMPVLTLNQPGQIQLESAGAQGPVVWSLTGGAFPPGLTLDADGLIAGTPVGPGGGYARVQADDGVTVTSKLVMVVALTDPTAAPPLTGAPLPDAGKIFLTYWLGGVGYVLGDGSYQPVTSISVAQALTLSASSGSGSQPAIVMTAGPGATPEVVDATTGAPITLEDPLVAGGWASFSPTGAWMASVEPSVGAVRLVDTTTWATERTIPMMNGCCLRWSNDGDELVLGTTYTPAGTEVPIVSVNGAAEDRTITVSDETCGAVAVWGPSDRIVLSCTGKLVTVSAADGSDKRVLAQTACPGGGATCVGYDESGGQVRFSPTGSHIVTTERVDPSDPWNLSAPTRVVIIADSASATVTPLTTATFPGPRLGRWF